MLSITRVFKSVALLADAIAMLASTVSEIDNRLRAVALEHKDSASGPIVLDHVNGQPASDSPADAKPEAAPNGRKGKARALQASNPQPQPIARRSLPMKPRTLCLHCGQQSGRLAVRPRVL